MKKQIASFCCLMVIQSSVLTAGEIERTAQQASVSVADHQTHVGPLRLASFSKATWAGQQNPAPDPGSTLAPPKRSWVERHPVWTGAMVGFAAGSVITYASTGSSKKDELFDFSGLRGAAVLVFGGVSAGIGALAGWGIGRSH